MSFLELCISLFAPHTCLGCGDEVGLLCADCIRFLERPKETCYRCKLTSPAYRTCSDCYIRGRPQCAWVAVSYSGQAKDLVWRLKYDGAQAAAAIMAEMMANHIGANRKQTVIVPVPTTTARIRQRGYDQATLIAHELSRLTGVPVVAGLGREGRAHQVGASRQQRQSQLRGAFRARNTARLHGKRVLLVDDVLTTGATFEAATQTLLAAGVTDINELAFAAA
jgi:ComF family protein